MNQHDRENDLNAWKAMCADLIADRDALKAEVERLTRELASSREDARRFYRVDGTSELMESPEAVVRARIAAAAEIERLRAEVERLKGDVNVAIAFQEAAQQDARRAAGEYEALKRLRDTPTPKPRPDREAIGRAAYEAHGTKGLHPWEKLNESAREDYRELGCAVAAALQPHAPPDIEAVARRIVEAVCWKPEWDEPTADSRQIGVRYAELGGAANFPESVQRAKREFVARVLREGLAPGAPAAEPGDTPAWCPRPGERVLMISDGVAAAVTVDDFWPHLGTVVLVQSDDGTTRRCKRSDLRPIAVPAPPADSDAWLPEPDKHGDYLFSDGSSVCCSAEPGRWYVRGAAGGPVYPPGGDNDEIEYHATAQAAARRRAELFSSFGPPRPGDAEEDFRAFINDARAWMRAQRCNTAERHPATGQPPADGGAA